jgi:hypothetical protein
MMRLRDYGLISHRTTMLHIVDKKQRKQMQRSVTRAADNESR